MNWAECGWVSADSAQSYNVRLVVGSGTAAIPDKAAKQAGGGRL